MRLELQEYGTKIFNLVSFLARTFLTPAPVEIFMSLRIIRLVRNFWLSLDLIKDSSAFLDTSLAEAESTVNRICSRNVLSLDSRQFLTKVLNRSFLASKVTSTCRQLLATAFDEIAKKITNFFAKTSFCKVLASEKMAKIVGQPSQDDLHKVSRKIREPKLCAAVTKHFW